MFNSSRCSFPRHLHPARVVTLVEETDIILSHFDDSSPDYETFCFDIEEKSSGSTTSHSYHSLPEYESFCFDVDHIKEKSSGNTTSYYDLSLPEYESFHFDLLIDPLPPDDRSDSHHEEFADELAHIITSPEYGSVRNHKKTVKNEQARTQESEEFKKKPKIQSRSQKSQAS
ncbi:hypothetical protein Tco_1580851, partial [Tanacetum coccineum]